MGVVKKNSISRATRVAKMSAGIAGSYLAYQLQRPFVGEERGEERRRELGRNNARQIKTHLQELRGPMMKLGQALSMQSHMLDAEVLEELAGLQMQAPPMHPTLMRAQFKTAFGKYPEEVYRSFEVEPFAAASLGQVHWAVTKSGEKVAVKIQYPAIREAIESDFKMLRTASVAAQLTGYLKKSVVDEAERGIMEETDYTKEAKNVDFFRKGLAPLEFVRVPEVDRDLSCDQVLTMSRLGGLRLQEFLKANPTQAVRDKVGENLTKLFFFQLFRLEALHADPHPGNYLFSEDGTIGLVDFGCVKYLNPEVVRCYAQFWSREWVHDAQIYNEIIRVIFGAKVPASAPRVRKCMNEIVRFYDQFHPLTEKPVRVDLGDGKFMAALNELAKVLIKNKFLSPEFLFLSRTESGMCNILHSLKARVPTSYIARKWLPRTT